MSNGAAGDIGLIAFPLRIIKLQPLKLNFSRSATQAAANTGLFHIVEAITHNAE
jgi:hypothetical protein